MVYDIFVIGGGVNGTAIARDAVGRGLTVALAEKWDLASETSSKSTKLYHGGLRYLEYLEFKLVREALKEREILLQNMPHISWPMRFVLPIDPEMRFDDDSPVVKWTGRLMPWLKGRRPKWMIRSGLYMYDHLGGRKILPPTSKLDLTTREEGAPLKEQFSFAYEYSDCWVDDSRLVVLMARDAKERGAHIMTRTKVVGVNRGTGLWVIEDEHGQSHQARAVVNASGPWVESLARSIENFKPKAQIKLVRGSHIVVPKLYDHEKAYFFTGADGRIIFAIPYEQEFTLIGTTEAREEDPDHPPQCSDEERDYLCEHASVYFEKAITPDQVVHRYSGVRPLYNDGAKSATAATREYVLTINNEAAPILNVFGGKITTHRRLAEDALAKLKTRFPNMGASWTQNAPLAGADFAAENAGYEQEKFQAQYEFMSEFTAKRVFRAYGLEAYEIFGEAKSWDDLGRPFGHGLSQKEVDHLIAKEFAQTVEDIIWRRSKLGLHLSDKEVKDLEHYIQSKQG